MASGRSKSLSQAETTAVSVSELTGHIKAILEGTFPSIWVAGEISDLGIVANLPRMFRGRSLSSSR